MTIVVVLWLGCLSLYFARKHYLFAAFVFLFGCYELTGPVLYVMDVGDELVGAQRLFNARADGESVSSFSLALGGFFIAMNSSYLLTLGGAGRNRISRWAARSGDDRKFFALLVFVLVAGVISIATNASSVRLLDYTGESLRVTPMLSYGGVLLVCVTALVAFYARERRWRELVLVLVVAAPLAYELFLTSRRQHFAPSALLILLAIAYARGLRARWWLAGVAGVAVVVIFGLQFWVRHEFTGAEGASNLFERAIAPQLGEFVAIGATSFYAWTDVAVGHISEITWGWHWIFHALNSVPYIELGDVMFPDAGGEILAMYRDVSPNGGLSMIGDAVLAGGPVGVGLVGMMTGALLALGHRKLRQLLDNGVQLTPVGVYVLALIATLVTKYRSGVGDMIQVTVNLTLLYWVMVWGGQHIEKVLPVKRGRPVEGR